MDINSALQKLFSLHQFGIKLGLENITDLLQEIGNPHKTLKTIHIAGSNGKGSTSSFIASILMEAGYKVGLYTSPHFVRYNERIKSDGKMIDDGYVAEFIDSLVNYIDRHKPTFFEITTALAFKYFCEQKVDYAVIETGLGGRLDATNVLNPLASVITSISLEHTQHLGDTIEKIAFEKAGIIKPGASVLTGNLTEEAVEVIENISNRYGCKYFKLPDFTSSLHERIVVDLSAKSFSIYTTPLRGDYQKYNAALAIKTVSEVLQITDGLALARGIQNVVKNTGIQGRYEIINDLPVIIMDSAHNPESLQSFIAEFAKEKSKYSETALLFGAMKDKAIPEMFGILKEHFDKIYITKVDNERAAGIEDLRKVAASFNTAVEDVPNAALFVENFRKEAGTKCLVVLGSMYLLGEIKSKKN